MTFVFELYTDQQGNEFSRNFDEGNKNTYHDLRGDNRYTENATVLRQWTENGCCVQSVTSIFQLTPKI